MYFNVNQTPVATVVRLPTGNTLGNVYQVLIRYRTPTVDSVTGSVTIVGKYESIKQVFQSKLCIVTNRLTVAFIFCLR